MRLGTRLAVLALVCWVAPAAMAGEIRGGGGDIVVGEPPASEPLADGRSYMRVADRHVLLADDPAHPFHKMAMDCGGACLMTSETSGTCMGSCTAIDAAGDLAFFTWDGLSGGTWKLAGGTGKFAGASGSGTWKQEGGIGAGFTRNSWDGTITMP